MVQLEIAREEEVLSVMNIAPPLSEEVLEQLVRVVLVSVNTPSVGCGTWRREGKVDPSVDVREVKMEDEIVIEGDVPLTTMNEMSVSHINWDTLS